jgi:heme exporter protein D
MSEGVITGGWEYVWLAYGLTGVAFLGYALMLILKLRGLERSDSSKGGTQ